MGRPRTCECGVCHKCKHREKARLAYQSLSLEERRALIARRDPEKVKAADRERYYRNIEKRQKLIKANAHKYVEQRKAAMARQRKLSPEKFRARYAVSNAIRDGKLTKGTECAMKDEQCRGRIQAHHEDYSKPLEVTWLCARHHGEIHRKYPFACVP